MAGIVQTILPKRLFDFGNLAVSATQTLVVLERIDISQYDDAILVVRTHDASLAGGTISAFLVTDGWCDEDPAISFIGSSAIAGPVTIAAGPSLGISGASIFGQFAALIVSGSRSVGSPLSATLSIDLCLRNPDESV
jgi:hypothetical protein